MLLHFPALNVSTLHSALLYSRIILQLQGTGFTALMFACKGGHLDTVFTLLGHSANTAIRNRVSHIHEHSLLQLIFFVTCTNTYSQDGMTAADVASINEQPEVYVLLELTASQTEDSSQGLEVSYTDQIV